jgi:hypothetical protein
LRALTALYAIGANDGAVGGAGGDGQNRAAPGERSKLRGHRQQIAKSAALTLFIAGCSPG